jgi:arginine deiminase
MSDICAEKVLLIKIISRFVALFEEQVIFHQRSNRFVEGLDIFVITKGAILVSDKW